MRIHSSNILVAFLAFVTLVSLTGYQVTGETSAVRLLGRLGAALVELDRWLPAHRDDVELLARDRPDQPLVLSDLPIDATIPSATALDAPMPVVEATITEAMGRRLYDEGYGAIQDEQGQTHLGLTEPLRWAVDGLDSGAHTFWRLALLVTGLALLVAGLGHFWTRRSPFPGLTVGSAIGVVLALAAWALVSFLGSTVDSALDKEIAQVAKDGVWIGLRNSFAATAIGLGGLYVYNSFFPSREEHDWDDWEEYDYEEAQEAPPY